MKIIVYKLILIAACGLMLTRTRRITRPDAHISFVNGQLFYRGFVYSGIVEERYQQIGTIRETRFQNGFPNGIQIEYLESSGQKLAKREFVNGENSGIHEGWFENGGRRFHYEYANANPNGDFWEWHRSGHPSLFARFENGRLIGKKMWREDGKIYMNFVFPEGRPVGVPGVKLCYQVRESQKFADSRVRQ
jgi:antitoxin component YwqK of YwqJK toxin-antitoxin module